MRQSLVVGNWKMNGSRESTRKLLADILAGIEGAKADIGVCVPFVFIPEAAGCIGDSKVLLGSQNVADQNEGAYTGEISAPMLKEFGCKLTLVGHSERRQVYGETDQLIAARYAKAIEHGLVPLLCIGETLEERENGDTFKVVDEQLDVVLAQSGIASFSKAVIAYEPVWAIGTGKTATSAQAQEVHAHIRQKLALLDKNVAESVQILYGGSVKADNAKELFSMPDIDGGLIGGASLDAKSFLTICHSA